MIEAVRSCVPSLIRSRIKRAELRTGEAGTAIVEFVVLGVLVMVPIAYAVIVVVTLHAATFGVVTAAREAGRAYVTAETTSEASARARKAAAMAMADQGMGEPQVSIRCLSGTCLSPGSRVRVEVSAHVAVPFVPTRSGSSFGTVPVTAVHETVVDSYRGSP